MIKDIIDKNKNLDVIDIKIEKLKEIFPGAFHNGTVDLEYIKNQLRDIKTTKEGYELNFLGKSYAKLIAALDTETVIIPDTEHNETTENQNSENLYISSDNLDALKHLLKSYWHKVKMIYIDPPYNTGSDGFIYNDSFGFTRDDLISKTGISAEEADRVIEMTSRGSSSHSAWLTFMYPRLYLAKHLLSDNGVIFISIDDNELSNLKLLCDDIFGESNFVANLIWKSKSGGANDSRHFATDHEYILCYAKSIDILELYLDKDATVTTSYNKEDENGKYSLDRLDKQSLGYQETLDFPIIGPDGKEYKVIHNNPEVKVARWRWGANTVRERYDELVFQWPYVYTKNYEKKDGQKPRSLLIEDRFGRTRTGKTDFVKLFGKELFSSPKPVKLIQYLIEISTKHGDIILDFFSGSGTTAQAIVELNQSNSDKRKFILITLPELIDENTEAYKSGYQTLDQIGFDRIKKVIFEQLKSETLFGKPLGFKHFTVKPISNNQLSKLDSFNPDILFSDRGILDEFGIETLLTTWKNLDGYGLSKELQVLRLDNYTTYQLEETIYLVNPDISNTAIKHLLEMYESEDFRCNKIVIFGYSFTMNEIQSLKDNLKQVEGIRHITLDVLVRY